MRTTQVTPGGIRVCGTVDLTPEELAAVDALADAARRYEEARRAALSDEERAAEDEVRRRAEERRARFREALGR